MKIKAAEAYATLHAIESKLKEGYKHDLLISHQDAQIVLLGLTRFIKSFQHSEQNHVNASRDELNHLKFGRDEVINDILPKQREVDEELALQITHRIMMSQEGTKLTREIFEYDPNFEDEYSEKFDFPARELKEKGFNY